MCDFSIEYKYCPADLQRPRLSKAAANVNFRLSSGNGLMPLDFARATHHTSLACMDFRDVAVCGSSNTWSTASSSRLGLSCPPAFVPVCTSGRSNLGLLALSPHFCLALGGDATLDPIIASAPSHDALDAALPLGGLKLLVALRFSPPKGTLPPVTSGATSCCAPPSAEPAASRSGRVRAPADSAISMNAFRDVTFGLVCRDDRCTMEPGPTMAPDFAPLGRGRPMTN